MKDSRRSKKDLIDELTELRNRVAELETARSAPKTAAEGAQRKADGLEELPEFRLRWPFHQLFDSMPDAYYLHGLEGTIVDANKATQELTGYKRKELIGSSFSELELLRAEDAAKVEELLARNAQGEVTGPDEFVLQREDGSRVVVEARALPVRIKGQALVLAVAHDVTEAKRTTRNLEESEELYRDLVEGAGIGILTDDREGNITYCNAACAEMFGYSVEEMLKQSITSIAHPDDIEDVMRVHTARIEGKTDRSRYEFRGVKKDGSTIFLAVDAVPLRHGDGIAGTRASLWDVTQRKQIEEEFIGQRTRLEEMIEERTAEAMMAAERLKQSDEKYRATIEQSHEGVFVMDPDSRRVLEANSTLRDLLGYSTDELKELVLDNFVTTSPEDIDAQIADILAEKHKHLGERQYQCKDGTLVDVEVSTSLITYAGKDAVCVVSRDITERKRAEDALRAGERRFERLLESLREGVAIDDAEGTIISVNSALCDMLGCSREEIVGTKLGDVASDEQSLKALGEISGQHDHTASVCEAVVRRKDGELRCIRVSCVPWLDDKGDTRGTVRLVLDVTGRTQAEEALWRSEQKYRTLTENINVGIYRNTTGPEGAFIEANPAMVRMFGYSSKEELLRTKVSDLYQDPEDRKALNDKMLSQGFVENEILQLKKKDGTPFVGSVSAVAVKDDEGTVQYYDGVIEDITDRGRAEQALHRSEARFAVFMDHLPAGVYIKDEHSRFLYVNRYLQDHFDADIWLRQISVHHFPRIIAEAMVDDDRRVLKEGPLVTIDTVVDKTGTEHVFQTHKFPIAQDSGPTMLGGIAVDVTERKRAEDQLQRSLKRVQSAMDAVVQAMAHTVEARDPYTAGHQRRVAQLACAIGRVMGFPEEQLRGLRMAGLIHDIGKITTPGELLSRPGKLSVPEMSIIQRHPQVGYDILKTITFSWPIAEIVAQHHERVDGSGYPHGLSGEDILLEARILGVADVVEAMSSHRPYRPARGVAKALNEITEHKGTLFDPTVVEACLHVFRKQGFEFEEQGPLADEPLP